MWYRAENGNDIKPSAVDSASSQKCVYVRKDFELIPATEEFPEHWEYMEQTVDKNDWETYQQVMANTSDLTDVNAALIELADIIGG